jgi:hypothetical protein
MQGHMEGIGQMQQRHQANIAAAGLHLAQGHFMDATQYCQFMLSEFEVESCLTNGCPNPGHAGAVMGRQWGNGWAPWMKVDAGK